MLSLFNGELSVVGTTVAATGIIIFILLLMKRNGKKDAGRRYPPSVPVLSLLGAIFRGAMNVMPEFFMKTAEKLGPVISCNIAGSMVVILNTKEAITEAFLRQSEAFADRNEFWIEKNILNPNFKGIIFARYNDAFKKYHKLCLSIFKEFGFGVNSVSESRIIREVESLKKEILKLKGQPFDPKLFTPYATFSVVSSILFGKTFMSSGDWHRRIIEGVDGYAKHIELAIDFAPFLRFLPNFYRKISAQTQCHIDLLKGVEEGIEFSRSSECEPNFVSRFIEISGINYDHQDLAYIVRDICLGGAETVSTSLQWAMVELANHPEVQTRFQREIDDVVPEGRLPSLDDKPRLPYTEAVILEIMRRRSLLPLYVPHATLKETEVLGYYIPKGCTVFGNVYSIHMDPKFWKDPENFRPERFLDEDQKIIGSENVMPFGIGKRSCIGEILGRQEFFLFLTSLVQSFDIRPPEGQDFIRVKQIRTSVTRPSDFRVRLIPRKKKEDVEILSLSS